MAFPFPASNERTSAQLTPQRSVKPFPLVRQGDDRSLIVWRTDDWSPVATITEPFQRWVSLAFSLRCGVLHVLSFVVQLCSTVRGPPIVWNQHDKQYTSGILQTGQCGLQLLRRPVQGIRSLRCSSLQCTVQAELGAGRQRGGGRQQLPEPQAHRSDAAPRHLGRSRHPAARLPGGQCDIFADQLRHLYGGKDV